MIIVEKIQERLESWSHCTESPDPDYGKHQLWVLVTLQALNNRLIEQEHSVYSLERPFNKISDCWYWVKLTDAEAMYWQNPKTFVIGKQMLYERIKTELREVKETDPLNMY